MDPIDFALKALQSKKIIAYPTEAVWGLGCGVFDREALMRILALKKRDVKKGVIIIAASFSQAIPFLALDKVPRSSLEKALASWPGPYTWVFPATNEAPDWITGGKGSIAVRVTAHPIAKAICHQHGAPIVSTSANPEGLMPAKTKEEVLAYFPQGIDVIVSGELGQEQKPSAIVDVLTGKKLR